MYDYTVVQSHNPLFSVHQENDYISSADPTNVMLNLKTLGENNVHDSINCSQVYQLSSTWYPPSRAVISLGRLAKSITWHPSKDSFCGVEYNQHIQCWIQSSGLQPGLVASYNSLHWPMDTKWISTSGDHAGHWPVRTTWICAQLKALNTTQISNRLIWVATLSSEYTLD